MQTKTGIATSSKWLVILVVLFSSRHAAADDCRRPTPVAGMENIRFHKLAVRSNLGVAVVDNDCNLLDRSNFGERVNFFALPPAGKKDTAYLYVKSYRRFATKTWDKIKMSRGDGWYSVVSVGGKPMKLDSMDDIPFRGGTPEKWNQLHSLEAATPELMAEKLGKRWHAYAGSDDSLPSTDLIDFWQTHDFDFNTGTVTNYLIRFPADATTPIPFYVGYDSSLIEFRLEIYSNVEGLSNQSYRFVFQ